MPEQHLGPEDVADPGEAGLIHQERRKRPARACDPLPGDLRGRVGTQRVRPRTSHHLRPFSRLDQPAPLGAPQVGHRVARGDPQPQGLRAGRLAGRPEAQPPDQAQMNPYGAVILEVDEQLLADRFGAGEHLAVDEPGRRGEASLGAGDPHRLPGEPLGQPGRQSMDDMPLGQSVPPMLPGQPAATAPRASRRRIRSA